ncbi:hypothetical protein GCM10027403_12440 [Arthrobacter tecti]
MDPLFLIDGSWVQCWEAEPLGLRPAVGVQFHHSYVGANLACHGCNENADGSSADDEHFVPADHLAAFYVVNGNGRWFDQGRVVKWKGFG